MPPRNLLPSPSPWEDPFCSPAMSATSALAWTIDFDADLTARASTRGSGTFATPTFVSVVEYGWGATTARPLVNALNSADLPAFGKPTMPKRSTARRVVARLGDSIP